MSHEHIKLDTGNSQFFCEHCCEVTQLDGGPRHEWDSLCFAFAKFKATHGECRKPTEEERKLRFDNALLRTQLASVSRRERALAEALLKIASLTEGHTVDGGFDCPSNALTARRALADGWEGRCVHDRDPWHRCDTCSDEAPEVAWAKAMIEQTRRAA